MLGKTMFYSVLITILITILILLGAGPVNGIVFSLHPIVDDRNMYFAPHLLGNWEVKELLLDGKSYDFEESVFKISCDVKQENRGYEMTIDFNSELELEFDVHLARYWGETWLELKASADSLGEFVEENSINPLLLVELYYVFKVEEMGKDLLLSVLDPVWTLERLQTFSRHMKFVQRELEPGVDRIYLTSEPHELRAFLARASRFQEALPYVFRLVRSEDQKR